MKNSYLSIRINAFRCAFNGIKIFCREIHARLQLVISGLVIFASWWFGLSRMEWVSVLLCIALVLSLEAMNTVVEKLTDLLHPEWGPKARVIKDVSAGAVLIASIFTAVIGLIVFLPKFFS